MKLPAPLAIALQTAFNRYAELDPDSKSRLQRLQGKVICFQIEGLELPVWFIFNEQNVEIVEDFGDAADAVISGGPFSMLALAGGTRSIFDGGVTITGETETAQQFSRVLTGIDVDWEEHLSRLSGDAVAHQVGRVSRGLRGWLNERTEALQQNTGDYLRDETNNVPNSWELEEFTEQVDELRDRVELLELRITKQQSDGSTG